MRSASSPTRAPPTRVTTTFSRPSCSSGAAKPSRPRSESSGSKVSRNGATPRTSSSLAGSAARVSGASRTSRTTSRAKAYSWPATSKLTPASAGRPQRRPSSRAHRDRPRHGAGATRSSWTKAAPISAAISRILTTAFLAVRGECALEKLARLGRQLRLARFDLLGVDGHQRFDGVDGQRDRRRAVEDDRARRRVGPRLAAEQAAAGWRRAARCRADSPGRAGPWAPAARARRRAGG